MHLRVGTSPNFSLLKLTLNFDWLNILRLINLIIEITHHCKINMDLETTIQMLQSSLKSGKSLMTMLKILDNLSRLLFKRFVIEWFVKYCFD